MLVEYERVTARVEVPSTRGDDQREWLRDRIEAELARRVPSPRVGSLTLTLSLTVPQARWLAGLLEGRP